MSELVFTSPKVLVTGATDGVGYATARRFVDEGATVYLHAPDQDSGEKAMTRLVKDGAEPLRLYLVVAGFTRLGEVARLAGTLATTLPALDVLVNNAAVAAPERRTYTQHGQKLTFQVNYLAPYLLTTKLVPRLASAGGRVVNVSSAMHSGGISSRRTQQATGTGRWRLTRNPSSPRRCTRSRWLRPAVLRSPRSAFIPACSGPSCCPSTAASAGRPAEEAAPILTTLGHLHIPWSMVATTTA
ncbi:MAG TPA: SDR family NAD(P)-dependent oxidoreductase [Mycobacterium sp.]|nr:SDR family NAD(P)-dependent oxidoreductase [Mycobacterium sp.]HUH69241.1 SDR family NAD(P)-dependent oxidoreductase [Mycobacterium sp.]